MTVLSDTSFLINLIILHLIDYISVQQLSNFPQCLKGLQGTHTHGVSIAMQEVHELNWKFVVSLFWGSSGIQGCTEHYPCMSQYMC